MMKSVVVLTVALILQVSALPILEDCERCKDFDLSDNEHSLCSFGCSYYLKTTLPGTADNTQFEQLAQKLLPLLRLMRQFHSTVVTPYEEGEEIPENQTPFTGVQLNHETMEFEPLIPLDETDEDSFMSPITTDPVFTTQIVYSDYSMPEVSEDEEEDVEIHQAPIVPDSTEELDQDFLRLLSTNPSEDVINFEDDAADDTTLREIIKSVQQKGAGIEELGVTTNEDDDADLAELSQILGLSLSGDPNMSSTTAAPPTETPTKAASKPTPNEDEESDDANEIPDEFVHPEDKERVINSNDIRQMFVNFDDDNHMVKRYKKSQ